MKTRILVIVLATALFICAVLLKTQAEKLRACESAAQSNTGKVVAVHPDGRTVVELPYGWLVVEPGRIAESLNLREGDCVRFNRLQAFPARCE